MNEPSATDIWRFVIGNELAVASHLRGLIHVLPTTIGHRVERVARRMEMIHKGGGIDDSNVQQRALAESDLLAIVSPLLERARESRTDDNISEAELLSDLQIGVCRLVRCSNESNSIVGIFVYPGLLLVGVIGILLLFSQTILPSFRTILEEFGIELPSSTKVMFSIGSFLESAWPLVLLVAFIATLPMILELCRSAGFAVGLVRWVEHQLAGNRLAIATWTRHVALLLQSGVNQDAALKTSMLGVRRWVRSGVWPWKFGLVEEALKLEDPSAKIAVLNQAADYYDARHRSLVQWWASFLPTIILCLLSALIVFVLLSVFMPLIRIITGLSGGFF